MSNLHSPQRELFVKTPFPSSWTTGNGNSRPDRNATGEGDLTSLLSRFYSDFRLNHTVTNSDLCPNLGAQLQSGPLFKPYHNLVLTWSPDSEGQYQSLSQHHQ